MNTYTTDEKVKIVSWYLGGNSYRKTSELFSVYFTNRPIPHASTVKRVIDKFLTTGCVNNGHKKIVENVPQNPDEDDLITDVLAAIEIDHNTSTREIAKARNTSHTHVHKILKKHEFFPYKYKHLHEIFPHDIEPRNHFCELMQDKCNTEPDFFKYVCFTDECTFTLNNHPNTQNYRYWATENPHVYVNTHTQYRQQVNVWAGILGNNIIGPFFIEGRLTGERYLQLLMENICPNIDAVADDMHTIWYQQDGAPAHYYQPVRDFLNEHFENSWIGREGYIRWPPRSPDLSPNDFFLWGYLKDKIYSHTPHQDVDSLKDSIVAAVFDITPQILQNVRRAFYDRLGYCRAVNGDKFEHLI